MLYLKWPSYFLLFYYISFPTSLSIESNPLRRPNPPIFSPFSSFFNSHLLPCLRVYSFSVLRSDQRTMWAPTYGKTGDVETSARLLQPMMLESQELRWAFIRKIYSIITVQMLLTIAVAATVVTVRPISNFVLSRAGLGLYIFIIILPFIVLCPLYYYSRRHPVNFLLLGLFTVSISFAVGLSCAFTVGKVILESVILTTVVVISLTLYTFWAVRRGQDFNFLRTLVFSTISVLMLSFLIQIFFPMGKLSVMIYGGLVAILYCAYIIYDTDNLMKRYKYDDYIWASVSLYLDIIKLFLSLLSLFRAKSR